jgi:hypothetical protein
VTVPPVDGIALVTSTAVAVPAVTAPLVARVVLPGAGAFDHVMPDSVHVLEAVRTPNPPELEVFGVTLSTAFETASPLGTATLNRRYVRSTGELSICR